MRGIGVDVTVERNRGDAIEASKTFGTARSSARLEIASTRIQRVAAYRQHTSVGQDRETEPMMDPIDVVNDKSLDAFIEEYMPPGEEWKTWTHPATKIQHEVTFTTAEALSKADFGACFQLIEFTSGKDYKNSKDGWKPKAKKQEMKLLDLKYLLVKHDNHVQGFCSLMPTYEDDYAVIYCYEIHLAPAVQGTGLGTVLMKILEFIGSKIPDTKKIMLTCFVSNERGVKFYQKLGYSKDEFSPEPKTLRNGTKVELDYVILSKEIQR